MFEDLLGHRSARKKLENLLNGEFCPTCKSRYIKTAYGFFMSADKYLQSLMCENCGEHWNLIYDGNLNIVDTKIGGWYGHS